MRVIAGAYKGRALKSVPGTNTRPTSDKIKESAFHQLGPFFEGGNCLDLFAGSGALGIEAMSRGMEKVVFVERSASAIRVIRKNVAKLEMEEKCEIYRNDAFRALKILAKRKVPFDLVILDPPYGQKEYNKLMEQIDLLDLVRPNGLLYLEHSPKMDILPPANFKTISEKTYNATTSITIVKNII